MIRPDDLIGFAVSVDWTDSEAHLRRAVSAAYYSLFHTIAQAGAALLVAGPDLRQRLARSYEHAAIGRAAERIERMNAQRGPGRIRIESELLLVAEAVRRLREAREKADYDLNWSLTEDEASELISLAIDANAAFDKVRQHEATIAFVLEPLLRDRNRHR